MGAIVRLWHLSFGRERDYYRAFRRMTGVTPDNLELYKLALVHRSASVHVEGGAPINNERLEYLGDAVLESIVSDYLFIEFPDADEGFLTQTRAKIVSRQSLNHLAECIGLDRMVVFNHSGSFVQKHLNGDAFEALVGALYLDKGYDTVNRIIINDVIGAFIDIGDMSHEETDFKSRLIEWCQKSKRTIRFQTSSDSSDTGIAPRFVSRIIIDSLPFGEGSGETKKQAEQSAASSAWTLLGDDIGDYILERYDRISGHNYGEH